MSSKALTFEQLNKIIDDCTLRLQEEESRFELQLEYDKKLLGKNLEQEERVNFIPWQISDLQWYQNDFETETRLIEHNLDIVEQVLADVECKLPPHCTCQHKPTNKEETYLLVEEISAKLGNKKRFLDACNAELPQMKSDMEFITEILIRSLKNLQSIESKTKKIKEKLSEVELYKEACYRKYKIRPAKNY